MVRHKSPGSNRQSNREEMISMNRASAKNRRLAEQMSRRSGFESSAVMDKKDNKKGGGNVKNRIDRSHLKSDVKDRLGVQNTTHGGRGAGGIQSRLGIVRRGRGQAPGIASGRANVRGRSPSIRGGSVRGLSTTRYGRGGQNVGRSTPIRGRGQGRGRGRGRGTRGRGVGANREHLDSELDNYMSESK